MRTVLSAFADPELARRAADELGRGDLTRGRIHLRMPPRGDDPSIGHPLDEAVTGGGISDFFWLLDRLFGTPSGARVDPNGADIVRQGGAVVVVQAADDDEAERVQAYLLEAGAVRQAHMPREGDLD